MMMPCNECKRENTFQVLDPGDRAECSYCNRVWSVKWHKVHGIHAAELTLIDDGDDHFHSIGDILSGMVGDIRSDRRRNDMLGLKRMMDHHNAHLREDVPDAPKGGAE